VCFIFLLTPFEGKVAKHGNRSSSGKCGSADIVEALGARLDLDANAVSNLIRSTNFGFLFAQNFHPAMKSVAPVRRDIGVRTIFNILGPLTNPAKPNFIVAGVGSKELGPIYASVFQLMVTTQFVESFSFSLCSCAKQQ
jgi:anthranilate phosphoribosyltransferase